MTPRIMGLDLSLTRSGIALPDGTTALLRPPSEASRGPARMDWIATQLDALTFSEKIDLVAVEGFAYGRSNKAHDIGGIGWHVRVTLYVSAVTYVDIPPAVVKRYATGRGNADKQAMQMAAAKRLGYDDDKPDDNVVDALWLRALALDAYGYPVCDMPQAQRDAAVKALSWPRLTRAAA